MTLAPEGLDPARRASHRPTREDFRRLFGLALPMVTVQVGLMFMGVVDTIMVGHVTAADLAGVALGNLYSFGLLAMGMGILMALDPVVSQAVGARDEPAAARGIQRGLLLGALLTVPTAMLFLPAGGILRLLGQPAEVVPKAAGFVHATLFSIPAFYAFVALRQSLQAMGRTRPIVVVILLANVLNALLCWALVFGHVSPALRGAVGAGVATLIARWCMALGLLAVAWRELKPALVPWHRDSFRARPLLRMLRLGAPIGIQFELEFGVFAVVALLMGRLGTVPMAAHQVAINIASLTFMVPLGVSGAASVLVGQSVGAGDAPRARRKARAALYAGFGFMALSGLALAILPGPLARLYSTDAAVVALAMLLIPIAGVFQVFDGLQVVSIGVLRGVGDTRTPMIVNVLGFWLLGLPASLWLAFSRGGGAVGLWWGLVVGLVAVAAFLLLRVRARLGGPLERVSIEH